MQSEEKVTGDSSQWITFSSDRKIVLRQGTEFKADELNQNIEKCVPSDGIAQLVRVTDRVRSVLRSIPSTTSVFLRSDGHSTVR